MLTDESRIVLEFQNLYELNYQLENQNEIEYLIFQIVYHLRMMDYRKLFHDYKLN
jgi:hypothetical protein